MTDTRADVMTADLPDKLRLAAIQSRIATIKHRLFGSGRIPDDEYRRLSSEWGQLKIEMQKVQSALMVHRNRRRQLSDHLEAERTSKYSVLHEQHSTLIRQLLMLRDEYQSASRDPTRTEAVRYMSNVFQERLSRIISGLHS